MSTRRIAASTLWQIASQAAMAFLSILATKFVAIGLSKELAGYYNSAYGYLQIFAVVADFGLYAVAVREVSRAEGRHKENVLGALLVLRTLILLVSMGVALAVVWVMPMWRGTPFPVGVAIASLVPAFTLLAGMIRTVFQTHYRMAFVFVAEVLQRLLTTIGLGLFILAGVRLSSDIGVYEAFLWIGGAGSLLLFVLSVFYARRFMRVRPHFDMALIGRLLTLSLPFGLAYLLLAMYRQLDIAFIALLRSDFAIQNAYYGFAGRVEDVAYLIPTFLLNSVLPLLSLRLSKGEKVDSLLGKTLFLLLLSGSTIALFSFLWSRPLTLLFATNQYLSTAQHAGSDTAFRLMSIPMFLNGLVLFSFYIFLARHEWRKLVITFGTGVLGIVTLNMLWTPAYGFVGAASALIVVHLFLTAVLFPLTLRAMPVRFSLREFLQWVVFSVLLAVILYATEPFATTALRTMLGGALIGLLLCGLAWVLRIHRELKINGDNE